MQVTFLQMCHHIIFPLRDYSLGKNATWSALYLDSDAAILSLDKYQFLAAPLTKTSWQVNLNLTLRQSCQNKQAVK